MRVVRIICALALPSLLLALSVPSLAQNREPYREGVHYYKLSSPLVINRDRKGRVDVKAFFWYGCPHCRKFEKPLAEWLSEIGDEIKFEKVPAVWDQRTAQHARMFFTAKIMKNEDIMGPATYRQLLDRNGKLDAPAKIQKFFQKHADVKPEHFRKVWRSFSVKTQKNVAEHLARDAELTGTPSMVVAGKYRVVSNAAIGLEGVLEVSEYLIRKEQRLRTEKSKQFRGVRRAAPKA